MSHPPITGFDDLPLGVVIVTHGCIESCNPAFAALLRQPRETWLGTSWFALMLPSDVPLVEHCGTQPVECRLQVADQQLHWVRLRRADLADGCSLWTVDDIHATRTRRAAQDELLTRQQMALEYADVGIALIKGRVIQLCNRRMTDMFGYAASALVQRSTLALFRSRMEYELLGRTAYPQLASGASYHSDMPMKRADGTPIWVRLTGKAIDPSDPEAGALWIYTDITEQKNAEDAMLQALQEMQALFDTPAIGIVFLEHRQIVRCNRRFEELFAYPAGTGPGRFARDWYDDEETHQRMGEDGYQRLARGEVFMHETHMRRADGSYFWSRWSGKSCGLREAPEASVWFVEDVTEQHQARQALEQAKSSLEQRVTERTNELAAINSELSQRMQEQASIALALRHSEEQFRLIAENMRDLICLHDRRGRFRYVSPSVQDMLGYTDQELIGKSPAILLHPESQEVLAEPFWQGLDSPQVSTPIQCRWQHRRGHHVWLETVVKAVFDERGEIRHIQSVSEDITLRKQVETALTMSESRFRAITEHAVDVVCIIARDSTFLYVSPSMERVLGFPPQTLLGQPSLDFLHPDDRAGALEAISALPCEGFTPPLRIRVRHADQSWRMIEAHARNLLHDPAIEGVVINASDVTREVEAEEKIRQLAYHDVLTGLPNRALLQDRLQLALLQANRHHEQVGVMFLDLDRFKNINDSLGHHVGDMLLKEIAQRLRKCVRQADTVSRLGGDEFVILLPHIQGSEILARLASQIIDSLQQPVQLAEHTLHSSTSVGISLYPDDAEDAQNLLRHADTAMYHAKESGRNNYKFFTESMNIAVRERLHMETALRRAIDAEQFVLHYQPQVDSLSHQVVGVEALVRWNHPEQGMISPARFIPLAEDTGLIVGLGEWVLREACRQHAAWRAEGHTLRVSVNLSPRQFSQRNMVARIEAILNEHQVPPDMLELEITEGVLLGREDESLRALDHLSRLGIDIALDDFGTGYSSLHYIKTFDIDRLKIDQSFVRDIATDTSDAAVVSAIIAMAHRLNIRVIAEGVETAEQIAYLIEQGCDEFQGYYFSRPLPADQVLPYLCTDASTGPQPPRLHGSTSSTSKTEP